MTSDLPFGDFGVAIAGDPEFSALVEKRCWAIAGVDPFCLGRVTERELTRYQPDLVVLAGYVERIDDTVLDVWPTIGFHPSLLPRYRGGSAVKWQLHYGEPHVGATVYRLRPGKMDAGPVVAQAELGDVRLLGSAGTVYRCLRDVGVKLLADAVAAYARGTFTETPQDETRATWHPLLRPGQSPAEYIHGHQAQEGDRPA